MSLRKAKFMRKLLKHGASATLSVVTGTACPCISYRGNNAFSEEWHRLNSGSAHCNGTGLITRTTTTTNIKGFFYQRGQINALNLPDIIKTKVGEQVDADLILVGTWDDDNDVYLDVSSYVERETALTYNSEIFKIRVVYPLAISEEIGQIVLLKNSESTGDVGVL